MGMMTFRFDFQKTLQASGVLLGLDANRMAYVRLLKLLSIADRELLAETARTITGDEAVALKNGPVLSESGASTPIPWQEMLEAQGKAELVEIVERNETARQYLDSLFGT